MSPGHSEDAAFVYQMPHLDITNPPGAHSYPEIENYPDYETLKATEFHCLTPAGETRK